MPWLNARVSAGNEASAIFSSEASASANPGNWKPALQAIALELQRARTFGFTQREIDDEKKDLIAGAERAVETENTTPAQAIISQINRNVADGEPTMSPAQRLDLLKQLLPTIKPDEVQKKFAADFDTSAVAFVATLPSGTGVPSEAELLDVGTKALDG